MLTKRIIPCLDVKNGRVVKGIKFRGHRDAGDPVELAAFYNDEGADELVFYDITASSDDRAIMREVVERAAARVFIPLTVGGGLRTVDDMHQMLLSGADKVSINTAPIFDPELISRGAERFDIRLSWQERSRQDDDDKDAARFAETAGRHVSGRGARQCHRYSRSAKENRFYGRGSADVRLDVRRADNQMGCGVLLELGLQIRRRACRRA